MMASSTHRPRPAVSQRLRAVWTTRGDDLRAMVVLTAGALFALGPLFQPGVPDMADLVLHLYRAVELSHLLASGHLYPRWAPNFAFGFGFPLFNYYAPLSTYLLVGLHRLGLDFDSALKVLLLAVFFLHGPAMYLWARRLLPPPAALLAALAYLYVPFRFREAYVQGDLPQFLALALAPLAFAATHALVQAPGPATLLATTLAVSAVVLSHNISALLTLPLLALYGLVVVGTQWTWRPLLPLGLAAALSASLTAFFWLPALGERHLVHLHLLTQGYFHFAAHFVSLPELFQPSPVVDRRAANPPWPFTLGTAHVLLALLAGAALSRPILRPFVLFGWGTLGLAVFLMLPPSTPVWQHVPLLAFTEFPWRLLGPAALATSLLAGLAMVGLSVPAGLGRHWPWLLGGLMLLLIGASLPHLYPRGPFLSYQPQGPADLARFEREVGAIGTTSAGEYYPIWVQARPGPDDRPPGAVLTEYLPPGSQVTWTALDPLTWRYTLHLPAPATLVLHQFYFPTWAVTREGETLQPFPWGPAGLLAVALPAGDHTLTVRPIRTPLQRLAEAWSLATLALGLLAVFGWLLWHRRRPAAGISPPTRTAVPGLGPRQTLGLLLALATLGLVKTALDRWTDWLSYTSPPEAVRGLPWPAHVDLADAVLFLGADRTPAVAHPGQTVTITLYWQARRPLTQNYRSYVKIMERTGGRAVAQSDHEHPGGIPTSRWLTAFYIRDVHTLTLPADLSPQAYRVVVGLYPPGGPPLRRTDQSGPDAEFIVAGTLPTIGPPLDRTAIALPLDWRYPEGPRLLGATVTPTTARPGERLTVDLFWRAEARPPRDYTVFVHLVDSAGQTRAQGDAMPADGAYPTGDWPVGLELADRHQVLLPADLPAGPYRLLVGLYDAATGQRLAAQGPQNTRTHQILLPITIQVEVRP